MADNTTSTAYDTFMNNPGAIATSYFVAVLTGIACFNALELILLVPATFQRWGGLYFWSLMIASASVLPYSIGFLLYFFSLTNHWVSLALVTLGWWPMVTGQSVVLYSRLHLLSGFSAHRRFLDWILAMIIFNAICLHIPTTVLTFMAKGPTLPDRPHQPFGIDPYADDAAPGNIAYGYTVMEKIQMSGFFVQEFIISAVYLWETIPFMKSKEPAQCGRGRKNQKFLWHLVTVNVIIILMDVALLVTEFLNLYTIETTLKGLVYSVKLRLEFAVLSQLVERGQPATFGPFSLYDEDFRFSRERRRSYDPTHVANFAACDPFSRRPGSLGAGHNGFAAQHLEDVDPLDIEYRFGRLSLPNRDLESTSRDSSTQKQKDHGEPLTPGESDESGPAP